ncbi:hypothetical protein EZV73_18300 [Acidaminobacter sp. JC074]|uniref:hypothetical protein n=1 Tax=Acidaminobacter sp. JC074 TaxID=2530199 RepID=UPI001F0D9764|nr:hypothetical protein [Acidaminobacter sp. JC074]MCH4889539.1 hypothetical protein [Acidaminobacter sp. JC074]
MTIKENLQANVTIDLPIEVLSLFDFKQSKGLYHKIEREVNHFDHTFDNTVVDSYAFYQVIRSKEVINFIFFYMTSHESDITKLKYQLSDYILEKVKKLYLNNDHHIFCEDTFLLYIENLINRLMIQ